MTRSLRPRVSAVLVNIQARTTTQLNKYSVKFLRYTLRSYIIYISGIATELKLTGKKMCYFDLNLYMQAYVIHEH